MYRGGGSARLIVIILGFRNKESSPREGDYDLFSIHELSGFFIPPTFRHLKLKAFDPIFVPGTQPLLSGRSRTDHWEGDLAVEDIAMVAVAMQPERDFEILCQLQNPVPVAQAPPGAFRLQIL